MSSSLRRKNIKKKNWSETNLVIKRLLKIAKGTSENETGFGKIGRFMGFEDSSDSESDENIDIEQGTRRINNNLDNRIILQSNLLKGLPNWLDRLFEGTAHRYYINYWPDFPAK